MAEQAGLKHTDDDSNFKMLAGALQYSVGLAVGGCSSHTRGLCVCLGAVQNDPLFAKKQLVLHAFSGVLGVFAAQARCLPVQLKLDGRATC